MQTKVGTGPCPVYAAFEHQVAIASHKPAFVFADHEVSYAELAARADAVAAALVERAPVAVALMVQDPAWMLACAFGVLKSGCYYVPVNPAHPVARNQEILYQTGSRIVLTDQDGDFPGDAQWIRADRLALRSPTALEAVPVRPDDWAYVLYTSGSTGRPKGIMHRRADMRQNVDRHVALGVSSADRVTLISADGFASAVSNPYTALLNGAALVPHSFKHDGVDDLLQRLDRTAVTVYYSFPSFLRQAGSVATGTARTVRLAYLGGEPVYRRDVLLARELFPGATAAVGLNSTETGLSRLWMVRPDAQVPDPVPVGGPVPGVRLRVLGEKDEEVPDGTTGEIAVSSPYIRPALLTDKGPVELAEGEEFRTGDRGRLDVAGQLVHLGRGDGMVKIRGYRVEVNEVEAAAAAVTGVSEAAVLPFEAAEGETELALYVVFGVTAPTVQVVRRELAGRLPSAFVPAVVMPLAAMPRTPNGKIDRKALPRPSIPAATPHAADVSADVAQRISAIWAEVLGVTGITEDDDFFLLGGTSISALRVAARARREFGVRVSLAVLFGNSTLEGFAEAVGKALAEHGQTAAAEAG